MFAELNTSKKTNSIKIERNYHFIVRQPVDKMLHMALLVFNQTFTNTILVYYKYLIRTLCRSPGCENNFNRCLRNSCVTFPLFLR